MNTNRCSRRNKIRKISYVLTLIAVLAAWGITASAQKVAYERQIRVSNQRAVASLSSYLDTVETDLQKMQYVNTQAMASGLSMSLCKSTAGAKSCLSELDAGSTNLSAVNKFLTQASDYVQSLNKKLASGGTLTDEDHTQITKLYEYAGKLADQISYLEEVMYVGDVDFENAASTLSNLRDMGDLSISYTDTISDAEDTFSDYPTLIYDGPFSDNMTEKESDMLKTEKEISQNEAKKRAAAYSSIEEKKLIAQEDENGTIKAYVFYYDGTSVAVTKNGGYLLYLLSSDFAGESKLEAEQAVEKARQYLEKYGFTAMKDSYYSVNDGICTANFAYTQDDVICYPDLIKVGVAMDTGRIVSVDASGYLMNHKTRTIPTAVMTANEAEATLSSVLTPKSCKTAVIPTDAGKEVYTYEFLCSDRSGNDVLVYIDAETGKEADIKLLLYADGGTLTR